MLENSICLASGLKNDKSTPQCKILGISSKEKYSDIPVAANCVIEVRRSNLDNKYLYILRPKLLFEPLNRKKLNDPT
jgi:hypothetical protein